MQSQPRIFYFSHADEAMYRLIRQELPSGFDLVTLESDSDAERRRKIVDCEVVIVAAKPLRRQFIDAAKRLRLVHHQGVGYQDTVDLDILRRRGIALALTPEGTTIGVAEHTVLLTLAACKHLPFADAELRRGRWHINRLRPVSIELHGRTIGFVGMGRIAQQAAARFKAFGTHGLYHDPYNHLSSDREAELGVEAAPLDLVLAQADVVTLHVPLTGETRHIINADALARMQSTAILVNTSRGPLVDEKALCHALNQGIIAAAALDVFEDEPLAPTSPLVQLQNVVLTPHIAAGTRDALRAKMRALFANVERFYRGEPMANRVDLEASGTP